MGRIYVTGHRNPDTDSIAVGHRLRRADAAASTRDNELRARCGSASSTRRRAGCSSAAARREPELPAARDAARARRDARAVPARRRTASRCARSAWLMAREDLDLVPIVDDDGALAGVMTERALARRYIRESREPSRARRADDASARSSRCSRASCWSASRRARSPAASGCMAMDVGVAADRASAPGDVVVVGDRADAQRAAIELGVGAARHQQRHRARATRCSRSRASAARPVVTSPLDSYVTAPHDHAVGAVPRADGPRAADRPPRRPARRHRRRGQGRPLPRRGRGRRAPAPDRARHALRPRQPARRAACCSSTTPSRRRACPASSRPRSSRSSTTTTSARSRRACPVRATFDPVGSTATLVIERFRQNGHGAEPLDRDDAARRDPVGHGDPQLADDDRARPRGVEYLERVLALDADGVRPRDVRARPPTSPASPPTRSSRATPRSTRSAAGRRSRSRRSRRSARASTSAATSCSRRWTTRARARRPRALRADGHRHPRQGHRALRVRRRAAPLERAFGTRGAATA